MATIETYSGADKVLRLTTSEALRSQIEVPVGCTDIRFGIVMGLAPGAPTQSFNPVVSNFECIRMLFTTGADAVVPTGKFVGVGATNGGSGNKCIVSTSSGSLAYVAFANSTTTANTYWPVVGSGVSVSGATSAAVNVKIDESITNGLGTKCGMAMIRLYESAGTVRITFRTPNNSVASLISAFTDATFRDFMTNLANTTEYGNAVVTGMTLSEVTGIFFSWPFYNVSPKIYYIGYRAIV